MKHILTILSVLSIGYFSCTNSVPMAGNKFIDSSGNPILMPKRIIVHNDPPPKEIERAFPYVVYRKCSPAYAVRTDKFGPGYYEERREIIDYYCYFGKRCPGWPEKEGCVMDTSNIAEIGNEYQFTDSLTAIRTYISWKNRRDSVERSDQIADSIYKCNHSYN